MPLFDMALTLVFRLTAVHVLKVQSVGKFNQAAIVSMGQHKIHPAQDAASSVGRQAEAAHRAYSFDAIHQGCIGVQRVPTLDFEV